MSSQRVATISMLAALAVALRFSFVAFPNIKPITAIFFATILYLGLLDAILVMVITMLVTGLFLGFGPVVLWQIMSFTVIMSAWRWLLPLTLKNKRFSVWLQATLVALSVMLYGIVISILTAYQFGFSPIAYWINGLFFDFLHAVSTFLFYPLIYSIFRRFLS